MAIDYDEARKRIILKFVGGMIQTYGTRRMRKVEQTYMHPGKRYWAKDEEWIDPGGTKRKGRFLRAEPFEAKQVIEVPEGVVPAEMLKYATAMSEAFLEVLRIAEDAALPLEHVNHPFMEVVKGKAG